MTLFTVANSETAFAPLYSQWEGGRLLLTGKGEWLRGKGEKLEVGEKGRREQEVHADGTAMQRRRIAPTDLAETFHGFSRGEATSEHRRKKKGRRRRRNTEPKM